MRVLNWGNRSTSDYHSGSGGSISSSGTSQIPTRMVRHQSSTLPGWDIVTAALPAGRLSDRYVFLLENRNTDIFNLLVIKRINVSRKWSRQSASMSNHSTILSR